MQVFISYGKRSSGELLIAYGFIPSESNPYDFVELELALDDEDPLYEAKLTALKDQGLSSYPWYYRHQFKWRNFYLSKVIHKLWLFGSREQCKYSISKGLVISVTCVCRSTWSTNFITFYQNVLLVSSRFSFDVLDSNRPQRFPIRKDGMPAQLLAYARLIVIQSMSPAQLSKVCAFICRYFI